MARSLKYKKGDVIIVEGQRGADAYVVEFGRVQVYRGGPPEIPLAVLGPGQIFGEMALITEQSRSASVRALENVEVLVLSWDEFLERLKDTADGLLPLLRTLSERVRNMTTLIEDLSRRSASVREAVRVHLGTDSTAANAAARPTSPIKVSIAGSTPQAAAALRGRTVTIDHFPFRIGRQTNPDDPFSSNELGIPDTSPWWVSRNHCMIVEVDGRCFLVDRGSRLGTLIDNKMVGGEKQSGRIELGDGQHEIRIGGALTPFRFNISVTHEPARSRSARRAGKTASKRPAPPARRGK